MSEEFHQLRRRIRGYVRAHCPRWWQPQDVDEVTQQALLEIVRRSDPSSNGLPRGYEWRIAYTKTMDLIREQSRNRAMDMSEKEPPARNPSPERLVLQRELGAAILNCLRELNGNRKHAAFLMLAGHSNREIARLTGWDPKKAENYVSRGRADLRKCLTGKGYQP